MNINNIFRKCVTFCTWDEPLVRAKFNKPTCTMFYDVHDNQELYRTGIALCICFSWSGGWVVVVHISCEFTSLISCAGAKLTITTHTINRRE